MNLIVKINQKGSDYHFAIYSDKKKKYFRTETNTKGVLISKGMKSQKNQL